MKTEKNRGIIIVLLTVSEDKATQMCDLSAGREVVGREWLIRMYERRAGLITKDEYFEWKLNCPDTCDDCGKYEPKKQWRIQK